MPRGSSDVSSTSRNWKRLLFSGSLSPCPMYLVRGEWDERDNTDPGHSWLFCFFHAFCCCSKPGYLHMMHFKRHMLLKHFVWIRQEVSPDVVWDLDKERGLETNPKPVQCSASYACHADSHTSFCLIHYNCICIYTCDCILSVFVFVLSLHVMPHQLLPHSL